MGSSKRRVAAFAGFGIAALGGWSGLAAAANGPSPSRLHAIGSSSKAAHKQPNKGVGSAPSTAPLIAVAFANNKATVLGGSAVPSHAAKDGRIANIPISAVQCSVNFTTRKTPATNHKSVTARWFSGISCTRSVELFGQAYLAESAKKFDGSGSFYKGVMKTASSGRSATVVNESNPSLYVWSATNIYFQEKPARGVIVVVPSANQSINSATTCKVVTSSSFGLGVHCDMYTNRF